MAVRLNSHTRTRISETGDQQSHREPTPLSAEERREDLLAGKRAEKAWRGIHRRVDGTRGREHRRYRDDHVACLPEHRLRGEGDGRRSGVGDLLGGQLAEDAQGDGDIGERRDRQRDVGGRSQVVLVLEVLRREADHAESEEGEEGQRDAADDVAHRRVRRGCKQAPVGRDHREDGESEQARLMTSRMTTDWVFATAPAPPRALSRTTARTITVAMTFTSTSGMSPPVISRCGVAAEGDRDHGDDDHRSTPTPSTRRPTRPGCLDRSRRRCSPSCPTRTRTSCRAARTSSPAARR